MSISQHPASLAAHVSLSSIFNCQKTDTHSCQKPITKTRKSQPSETRPIGQFPGFL